MLDRLFFQTEHGPDMECLPSAEVPTEFESLVYAMDLQGMCLVANEFERVIHIDELRRQLGQGGDA